MTPEEHRWFEHLASDRAENAKTLEKPSMRGIQRSVVEKYSDQAHFIYELLQNADDVKASQARFKLHRHGLYFIHNGSVRFTLSNPANEEHDSANGSLGHLNAITSIANSSKKGASIGKFGVGFKAVFQYTSSPHIYEPLVRFKIERFIVPSLLEVDIPDRAEDQTIFYFPFDLPDKSADQCYEEILEKLQSLEHPVLFLKQLEYVAFEAEHHSGRYSKEITKSIPISGGDAKYLTLSFSLDGAASHEDLLQFSRTHPKSGHPCCLCYKLDAKGKLQAFDRPAYCFFPTKEVTNLKFLIHGPFLLTDSREGIKASEPHNRDLVQFLANLAADSLQVLRDAGLFDDNILSILPYDTTKFSELEDRRRISFLPFYDKILNRLKTAQLIPVGDGVCCHKENAFWASDTALVELISDSQLAQLTHSNGAKWAFKTVGRKELLNSKSALVDYIDGGSLHTIPPKRPNLIAAHFEPDSIFKRLSQTFIETQPFEWLHRFYQYLGNRPSYLRSLSNKAIFLDQDGTAAPAFDEKNQLILFLPDEYIQGYRTVHNELTSHQETLKFLEKFGLKKPELRDEIYNKILPTYDSTDEVDTGPHFEKFFKYYNECPRNEIDDFIQLIRNKEFVLYRELGNTTIYRDRANLIYWPSEELKDWFEPEPETNFLALDTYLQLVGESKYDSLKEFFVKLGVKRTPQIIEEQLQPQALGGIKFTAKGKGHQFTEKTLSGCRSLLSNITWERSKLIWSMLSTTIPTQQLNGVHTYTHYGKQTEWFESSEMKRLKNSAWIFTKNGESKQPSQLDISELHQDYDTKSAGAKVLIDFLKISDYKTKISALDPELVKQLEFGSKLRATGFGEDEILALVLAEKKRLAALASPTPAAPIASQISSPSDRNSQAPEPLMVVEPSMPHSDAFEGAPRSDTSLWQEIQSIRTASRQAHSNRTNPAIETVPQGSRTQDLDREAPPIDRDEYTPRPVNFEKKISTAKEKLAVEIDKLERQQSLQESLVEYPKYSYAWVKTLLELEAIEAGEKNAKSKTISINFAKVAKDEQTERTLILSQPSQYVPVIIEELSGVPVQLEFKDGSSRKVYAESFTAKEYSLRVKVKTQEELRGLVYSDIIDARITVQNPNFLLESLIERFRDLKLPDDFDMKANLPSNVQFVFGPPGTGKTTHLARNVLIPTMKQRSHSRVLVLTPTNKAADVLTLRIMESMGEDTSYLDWLARFGTCADEKIESSGAWRDRDFPIDSIERAVVITTIARFTYDGFSGEGAKRLYQMDWDLIVIDEASMIALGNILYPLYRSQPEKFIIAGDPYQIEPIVANEAWKDENIYTIVGLARPGSFATPVTEPHPFEVHHLGVQYRSIPSIGEVFSKFTYDGLLKHYRSESSQTSLRLEGLELKSLNLIKFPVSKFESIYRSKSLISGSSYQTYSALLTFEMVRKMALQVASKSSLSPYRIGIIAPYRVQADLISRLMDSWNTKPDSVDIQVGTIHGFQGDECDLIVAVLNPPPHISRSPQMFLNKQNILNVAISRAKDHLIVIMPDDETDRVEDLFRVKRMERLIKNSGHYQELSASFMESWIFGSPTYLEDNTFSTGHQSVNVYRKPERYYEVRSDNSAVDVQIHEKL